MPQAAKHINFADRKENDATVAISNITRSHLCLRVRGDMLTSPEKEHWLKHTRLVNAIVENASKELLFLDISTATNARNLLPRWCFLD